MENTELIQEVTQLHADFCTALADTRRLLIIYALSEGGMNVTDLSEQLDISQPSTSRHLKILRERGLVQATREGTTVTYELTDDRLIQALDLLRTIMRDQLMYRAHLIEAER